ncbi:MAG TPA: hypothetical protein VND87_12170 [Stellaceae bacterium]|nr:hypothetical protein [Stellaceae bacterium]
MAADTYVVSTSLVLRDDLIIGLRRAAEAAGKLDSVLVNIEKRLGTLGRGGAAGFTASLDEMKVSATALNDTLKTLKVPPVQEIGLSSLNRSLGVAEGRAARLKESLATLRIPEAAASRVPLGGGGAGGGAGRGGGGRGGHGGGGSNLLLGRGGHGGEMGSEAHRYAGYGVVGGIAYGTYEQGKVYSETNAILLGTQQPFDSPYRSRIEAAIQKVSAATGMSYTEAGESVKNTMLGFPNIPFDQRLGIAVSSAEYGMIEHLMKPEISVPSAVKAGIGLTHMAGNYSPEAVARMQSDIAAISTRTPENLGRIETAASYAMPMARVAGIAPETVFGIITANQIAGVTNTKSGTWLGSLITTGLDPKGGVAALISSKAGRRRAAMMRRLGLMDEHGRFTGMEYLESGRLDLLQQDLQQHLERIPKAERAGDMAIATGSIQAGRQLALLSEPNVAQIAMSNIDLQHTFLQEGIGKALDKYTKADPTLQLHRTLMNFTNALANIGTVTLPLLTSALSSIDHTLSALIPGLPGAHKNATPRDMATSGAVLGGGIGYLMGGPPGALVGAGIGAATGAGVGLGYNRKTSRLFPWQTRLAMSLGGPLSSWFGSALNLGTGAAGGFPSEPIGSVASRVHGIADPLALSGRMAATTAAISQTGAKNEHATLQIGADIVAAIRALPAGIRGAVSAALAHEAGAPPSDAGGVSGRIHPLYPATAR